MLSLSEQVAARGAECRRLARRGYTSVSDWLDTSVFPLIVRYATSRPHILALLGLGVVLMLWHDPLVELVGGNYTNIVSALVSCIVLLQQVAHHREVKRLHADHQQQIAALHQKLDRLNTPVSTQSNILSGSPTTPKTPRPRSRRPPKSPAPTTPTASP